MLFWNKYSGRTFICILHVFSKKSFNTSILNVVDITAMSNFIAVLQYGSISQIAQFELCLYCSVTIWLQHWLLLFHGHANSSQLRASSWSSASSWASSWAWWSFAAKKGLEQDQWKWKSLTINVCSKKRDQCISVFTFCSQHDQQLVSISIACIFFSAIIHVKPSALYVTAE